TGPEKIDAQTAAEQDREPDLLNVADKNLRRDDQRQRNEQPCAHSGMRFTSQAISQQQNPWNVCNRCDEIDVNNMKQVVTAEGEDHRAEPARVAREVKSFKQ